MNSTFPIRPYSLFLKQKNRTKAAFSVGAWLIVAVVDGYFMTRYRGESGNMRTLYFSALVTATGGALLLVYVFQILHSEDRARQARREEIERKARSFSQITDTMLQMLYRLETFWCNNPKPLSFGAQQSLERIRNVAHLLEARNERIKLLLQLQSLENTKRAEGLLLLPIESDDKVLSVEINYSLQPAETIAKELRTLFTPVQDELVRSEPVTPIKNAMGMRNEDFNEMHARRAVL